MSNARCELLAKVVRHNVDRQNVDGQNFDRNNVEQTKRRIPFPEELKLNLLST